MSTQIFPLADVLSITTGRLLSRDHMAGIYRLLNHMTGDDLFTHQLPRAADTCGPALVAQHPFLGSLMPPAGADPADLYAWLTEAERVHGTEVAVVPLDIWEHQDGLEEAADLVGADKIWLPDAQQDREPDFGDQFYRLGSAAARAAAAMRRFSEAINDGETGDR